MSDYDRLRPHTEIERCECDEITGLILVDILTENPIHCLICKNEIDPEVLGLSVQIVDKIAGWLCVHSGLDSLWLDSGEYETWAKEKLSDKNGQVNKDGMEITKELSKIYPTYYWWFNEDDKHEPEVCPLCSEPLTKKFKHGNGECIPCRLII